MVLERLINPKKATGHPWEMFFIGFLYSLVGAALGYWVFYDYTSVIMVAFTTLVAIPFVYSATELTEKKKGPSRSPFQKHRQVISMFTFLFLGFTLAFCLLYLLLPSPVAAHLFKAQTEAITEVNAPLSGSFFFASPVFLKILSNNLIVLFLCFIFSFLYGVGALFILSWNASVLAAALGGLIRSSLHFSQPFSFIPLSFLRYFLHGIPEVVAYFMVGLAGGLISLSLMKKGFRSPAFTQTTRDSFNLIAFAVLLLVLAAFVEVFISFPLLK